MRPASVVDAPGSPAALVLEAAAELRSALLEADPSAWRDAAVVQAVEKAWLACEFAAVTALAAGYDALLLLEPGVDSGLVVLRPVGNAERRHRGAFSTPPVYAASLAERALPEAVLADFVGAGEAPAVVDPACGAGALLRAVLARLLRAGVPTDKAFSALHGVDADLTAVLLCRASLAAELTLAGSPCRPSDLVDRIIAGDALLGPTPRRPAAGPGVVWHSVFPEVLARPDAPPEPVTGWQGGFDAVVANPPWERLKVHARDWAGAPPPGLRDDRADVARSLRDAGRHPLTGTGELNAYLPFVETCWRLLAPGGRAALLVPAGIASDRSAADLLEALAATGSLDRLHLIDPVAPIFAGVSARIGVSIIEISGGTVFSGDRPEWAGAEVAIGLPSPDEPPGPRAWLLPAALLRAVNPNTGTAPLFGSATDAQIVTAVHRRVPVLRRRQPPSDQWQLRLVTPLHMTRDARFFRSSPGDDLLPLWEAKHCALLDPFGGSMSKPRYWVPRQVVLDRYGALCERGWLAGFRNVSTSSSPRTLLPTPLPVAAVGNSLPLISADRLPLLLAALSSIPIDYLLRQKHAGANVNFFKVEQVPVPPPEAYDQPSPWSSGTIEAWVLSRFARSVVWAPGLEALAAELGRSGVDVAAEVQAAQGIGTAAAGRAAAGRALAGRALARAELDAAHARLLGLTRGELEHLLNTFGALKHREQRDYGRFFTAERVLDAYDRLD